MIPAVFLDRDGTLIRDRGALKDPKRIDFYSGVFPALRALQKNYRLFIITNQPWIGLRVLTQREVDAVNRAVVLRLRARGVRIAETYACPHAKEENCACRKPKTLLARRAAKKHNLDLARSWVVGDHGSDVQLALNFGGQGVYVLTGHGRHHAKEFRKESKGKAKICRGLPGAVKWILTHPL